MTEQSRLIVLSDEQWAVLGPLIDECRPRGKTEPVALRETVEAIVWRHQNGAKWRSVPSDLVPWWRAAQTFIRWSKLGSGNGFSNGSRSMALNWAWPFSTALRSGRTTRRRGRPKRGIWSPARRA